MGPRSAREREPPPAGPRRAVELHEPEILGCAAPTCGAAGFRSGKWNGAVVPAPVLCVSWIL